jgi:hypothetical protein
MILINEQLKYGASMSSAGFDAVQVHPTQSSRPRGGGKLLDMLLLLFGCAAFVVARSISTRGQIHIDQFEIWILGVVPYVVLNGLALLWEAFFPTSSEDKLSKHFVSAWIVLMVAFCILSDAHVYQLLLSALAKVSVLNLVPASLVLAGALTIASLAPFAIVTHGRTNLFAFLPVAAVMTPMFYLLFLR